MGIFSHRDSQFYPRVLRIVHMKLGSGSDGGGTPCMINENNFDRDLRLELSRARYDICDNIMSSRPVFVERGGQESLSFLSGFASICETLTKV